SPCAVLVKAGRGAMSIFRWRPSRRVGGIAPVALLGLSISIGSCSQPHPAASSPPILRIGTAFGPLTQPLTTEYQRTLTGVRVQPVPAPNSIDVVHAIRNGTVDFGVAYSNDTYAAYWGP